MHRCKYNKFASCNIKECDTCEVYKFYQQGRADQKGEDNTFFNFEAAWEMEKKKVKAESIDEFESLLYEFGYFESFSMRLVIYQDDLKKLIQQLKEQK